jgi:hypothetical protein
MDFRGNQVTRPEKRGPQNERQPEGETQPVSPKSQVVSKAHLHFR